MIQITWSELAAITAISGALITFLGVYLKLSFLTEKQHREICSTNQAPLCSKIEQLRTELRAIEVKREEAKADRVKKDLWLAQALRRIADKVGADIVDMP